MLRALWFLTKTGLFVAAVIWLARQPGEVTMLWMGYEIRTTVGLLLAVFAIFLLVWTFWYRIWRALVSVPAAIRRQRAFARREKGYRMVTSGLVAVAAGDAGGAERAARKAEKMVPDAPLTQLLAAQAALLSGDAPRARRAFQALLDDESAAFFGLRGLLNESLRHGDSAEALRLIREADRLQPKRQWVIRQLFELETRNREWTKAEKTLKRAEKLRVFTADMARRHRQALLTARAQDMLRTRSPDLSYDIAMKAAKPDLSFTPAVALAAGLAQNLGKERAARKLVEKSWALRPHPDLTALWMKMQPAAGKNASVYDRAEEKYRWMTRLTKLNPDHRDSHRAAGAAALEARMWKEARTHLMQAGDYRMLAQLERAEGRSEAKTREWLEKAADQMPDPRWVCTACHHPMPLWTPNCPQCGRFDTAEWMSPAEEGMIAPLALQQADIGILSPPEYALSSDGGRT